MAFDPVRFLFGKAARPREKHTRLAGEHDERIQRLQIGFFGIAAMLLLVGLANIIMNSVKENEASAVPEAVPTAAVSATAAPARDPLADAGVVPDLPAEPAPGSTPTGAPPSATNAPTPAPNP